MFDYVLGFEEVRILVQPQSKVFLGKDCCSVCAVKFDEDYFPPKGLAGHSLSIKDRRNDTRHYFPVYHLVCQQCFDRLERLVPVISDRERFNETIGFDLESIPEWSFMRRYIEDFGVTPCGTADISEMDDIVGLVEHLNRYEEDWEEFNFLSGGFYYELNETDMEKNDEDCDTDCE